MKNSQKNWTAASRAPAARRFVAVDFDSRQVRLVQAERAGGGARIVRLIGRAAPAGMDVADPKAVGGCLRDALKEHKLLGWPLAICVPRGMAVLKTLAFPPGTEPSELAAMVQYQVEKELPFRAEEAVVDFTAGSHFQAGPVPEGSAAGTCVLVAAVRVPVVDYFRQIALAAGSRLLRLGLRPYADHACFAACEAGAAQGKCAVVHLTADETEIDVMAGDGLAFSRSVLGKIPPGPDVGPAERAEAAAGVVAEVLRSLQSYHSVEGGGKVDQVYLAGGTGIEPLVAKELSERLGVGCRMLDPAPALRLGGGNASEFLSALGLALSVAGPDRLPVDFLNPKRPAAVRNVRRTRAMAGVAAAFLLLLAGIVLGSTFIGQKKARLRGLQSIESKLMVQKKDLDAKRDRAEAIGKWQGDEREWLYHLACLCALMPPAEDAYISTTGISGNADGKIHFTVLAVDAKFIADTTLRLKEAGYKTDVVNERKTGDPKYPHTAEFWVSPKPGLSVDLAQLSEKAPNPLRPADDMDAGEALPRPRPQPVNPNVTRYPNPQGGFNPPGSPAFPGGADPNRPRRGSGRGGTPR